MLFPTIFFVLFVFSGNAAQPVTAATSIVPADRVVIEKRRVVIVRTGKFVRDFPTRRRAVISYPFIRSGASNAAALRKVRALLQLKNIFDTSIAEYREDTWLDEFDYKVNYNRNFILDITFMQNGTGAYPDGQTRNFAVNLKTGEVIKARDVFKPEALKTLAEMVDRKLQAENKQTLKEMEQDSSLTAEDRSNYQEQFAPLKFEIKNLDDFSINDKGITFLYDAGFPHVIQAIEPVGQYFFSYEELRSFIKPEGLLGIFVR
ncbi:MAG TPA: DUF3298 domain-containing protein [Pyrinomonadaceae bacterium]|nr:DUF3298 domain-containing protein [Pyrinomonadaceae bacterium]